MGENEAKPKGQSGRYKIIFPVIAVIVVIGGGLYLTNAAYQKGKNTELNGNGEQVRDLQIEVIKEGEGEEAKPGDIVSVHYIGTLENGSKFDSSVDRGTPFTFTLGAGQVIRGWDEGILGMKAGGKRKLTIPPRLGYGEKANGEIPPNSVLIFEVEMINIHKPGQ